MYSQSNIRRFNRKVRNDPYFGVFKHRFFLKNDNVNASEIAEWLEGRYIKAIDHQYRLVFYHSVDGNFYAHAVYMQNISANDLLFAKMRWNLSDVTVQRGDRVKPAQKQRKTPAKRTAHPVKQPLTTKQAHRLRAGLLKQAGLGNWSAARLRAKQAWVTMRTVGWVPPSSKKWGV